MMRRPTRRVLVVILVGLLLIMAGSTAQAGWLFVLAAGVMALVSVSVFSGQRLSSLSVSRALPPTARAGDQVRVEITVRNEGRRSSRLARLEDHHPGLEPAALVVERLPGGSAATIISNRMAERRGRYEEGEISLLAGAPFGFVRSRRTFPLPGSLLVLPRVVELTSFPILEPSSVPAEVLHERARTRAGQEYLGVREYRPGDPRRSVHWRTSARAGQLVVREYEDEVATLVGLAIGGSDFGKAPDSAFEALVSAAASIGLYALATGHPIDLVRAERAGEPRLLGEPSPSEVMAWLAEAEPVDASLEPLVTPLLRRIGRRGTIVIFAPDGGRAGADLPAVLRRIETAGCRAIAVVAESFSWDPRLPIHDAGAGLGGGRAIVRVLRKGEDLKACLQG